MSNTDNKEIYNDVLGNYFDAEVHPMSDVQLSKYYDIPRDVILDYRREHNIPTYIERYKNIVDELLDKLNKKTEEQKTMRSNRVVLHSLIDLIAVIFILVIISIFILLV